MVDAGTREQSDLTHELKKVVEAALQDNIGALQDNALKKVVEALQDNMTLSQIVLRSLLRPVSSSVSNKRLEDYRRTAIEYYYGSHADMSRVMCMVTGEEVDIKQITAGHIYRQGWGTGILVSIWA